MDRPAYLLPPVLTPMTSPPVSFTLPGLTLGCTSFLVYEPYISAFRYSASVCRDVSLLLNEPGQDNEFLITEEEVREIGIIAAGEGTGINIHLPSDGNFDTRENARLFTRRICQAIKRALPLNPHSWVLHIPVMACSGNGQMPTDDCNAWTRECLEEIAAHLPSPDMLCLENLETFRTDILNPLLDDTPYSRCMDIGHVWKDGLDPVPLLREWYPRIRMFHLHGIVGRDHKSLKLMSSKSIDSVMHPLWKLGFPGAITLEVFTTDDIATSHAILLQSYERYLANNASQPDLRPRRYQKR